MSTDDRWPPTPPRDNRGYPGAPDPRLGQAAPRQQGNVYGRPAQGAPQGVPPQGMPPQGMPPQGMPPQGMPPQGPPRRSPEGYAPRPPRPGQPPTQRRGAGSAYGPKRRRKAPILAIVALLIGVGVVGVGLRYVPGSPFASKNASSSNGGSTAPTPTTPPPPPPLPFHAATLTLPDEGKDFFVSWALLDRRSGEIVGSDNMAAPTWTASMIKGWLAADYLHQAVLADRTPTTFQLHELEIMIRDSDNNAATWTYNADGKTKSIARLISTCKLKNTKAGDGWGLTTVSAQDTVVMANCIASGVAGPKWTAWLLGMMREVRGLGDFGIRNALPAAMAAQVSIKNGWLPFDNDHLWHVNCMAIGDTWTMAVLLRYRSQQYPSAGNWDLELPRGQQLCQQVASELINPEANLTDLPTTALAN